VPSSSPGNNPLLLLLHPSTHLRQLPSPHPLHHQTRPHPHRH
jgi:hypothetical protein